MIAIVHRVPLVALSSAQLPDWESRNADFHFNYNGAHTRRGVMYEHNLIYCGGYNVWENMHLIKFSFSHRRQRNKGDGEFGQELAIHPVVECGQKLRGLCKWLLCELFRHAVVSFVCLLAARWRKNLLHELCSYMVLENLEQRCL